MGGSTDGKLHINRDKNVYMLVRNDTHETLLPLKQLA